MTEGVNPNKLTNPPKLPVDSLDSTKLNNKSRSGLEIAREPSFDSRGGEVINTATRNLQSADSKGPLTFDSSFDFPNLGKIEICKKMNNDGSVTFYLRNNIPIPVEVRFDLKVNNMPVPKTIIATPKKPGEKKEALTEAFTIRGNYSYKSVFSLGNPSNQHDNKTLYTLPFKKGQSYECSQGEHGKETHKDDNEFAIDFNMPEGTEFTAMRDGVVIAIKQDSNKGGKNIGAEYSNFIWILHNDGSIAKYVHMKHKGAKVKVGKEVKAGDVIGISGSTGRASGPHLHVQVDVPKGSKGSDLISIPFKDKNGKSMSIEEGKTYSN